jgi:hypothetical protein
MIKVSRIPAQIYDMSFLWSKQPLFDGSSYFDFAVVTPIFLSQ